MRHHIISFSPKRLTHCLLAVILSAGLAACASGPSSEEEPSMKQSLTAGFARQVIHPHGPVDRSAVDGMPGELSSKIYRQRYVERMSSEDKKKKGNKTASSEFNK